MLSTSFAQFLHFYFFDQVWCARCGSISYCVCGERLIGAMTAEWLYPPGVGPLCGAELEAWYEDLQDILGSDAGGAKLTRAPPCSEVSNVKRRSTVARVGNRKSITIPELNT